MRTVRLFLISLLCFGLAPAALMAQAQKKATVDGLIFDLKHPEVVRRKQAALTLGLYKVHRAVPALIEASSDADDGVRLEVVKALVEIRDPRALHSYITLTADARPAIQKKAIQGITELYVVKNGGFKHGVKQIVNFVNPASDDYNPLVVEPDVPVSQEAIEALSRQLASSNTGVRKAAATALGILRAAAALPAIQERLALEGSNGVKVELIRAIYKIGDPAAGPALLPLIRDPNKKVHDEAILTVGRLRVKEAVPQLRELYESGIEERRKVFGFVPVTGPDDLQKRVLEALSYIGDPSCQDIFLNALQDQRASYRRYGAEGLGRVGDASSTSILARRYFREDSGSVRLALNYALYRLGREEHLIELVKNIGKEQAYDYLLELEPERVRNLYDYVRHERNSAKVPLLEVIGLRGDQSAIPVVEEFTRSRDPEVLEAATVALRRLHGRYTTADR